MHKGRTASLGELRGLLGARHVLQAVTPHSRRWVATTLAAALFSFTPSQVLGNLRTEAKSWKARVLLGGACVAL